MTTSMTNAQPEPSDLLDAPETLSVPANQSDLARVVEAILFASPSPLTTQAIRDRLPDGADVGGALLDLKAQYAGRGVTVVEMDGTWAVRTSSDLGDALQIHREVRRKMSRAAMETLAIIAYHQPVTRAEIENIRGVETNKGTIDVLLETGWIRPGRRRETPGRPLTWVTTTEFLDHFGLEALTDLPGLDDLKASGLLDRRPAIDTLSATGNLFADEALASDEESEESDSDEDYEDEFESEDEDASEDELEEEDI